MSTQNTNDAHAREIRQKAIERLHKRFGPYLEEIKAKAGLDIQSLIDNETLSPVELSRLANRQEVLMEGSFYNPASTEPIYQGFVSLTLKELPAPPAGPGWMIFMYKVKSVNQDGRAKPVKSTIPDGANLFLNNQTYAFDSEEVVAWRFSGKGIIQKTEQATFLFTPSIWDENIGTHSTVNYIRMRIQSRCKNEMFFLPLDEEKGYIDRTKTGGFTLSDSDIDKLVFGELVMLQNNEGKKTCVRFDCSRNNIIETLPLSLAVRLKESVSKDRRKNERNVTPAASTTDKKATAPQIRK